MCVRRCPAAASPACPLLLRHLRCCACYLLHYRDHQIVIAFPYRRNGVLVSCKYRDINKKFWQERHTEKIFYGLDDIKDANDIIIVEGVMDKLAMEEGGFRNCVSVPNGASSSISNEELPPVEQVVARLSQIYPKDMEAPPGGVDDLTKLSYLHEPGILQILGGGCKRDNCINRPGCWKVWVNHVKDNAPLFRPNREMFVLDDAVGSTVAWPRQFSSFDFE